MPVLRWLWLNEAAQLIASRLTDARDNEGLDAATVLARISHTGP